MFGIKWMAFVLNSFMETDEICNKYETREGGQ